MNGLRYTAAAGGAVALVAGLIGVATAGKGMMPEWKTKKMAVSGVIAAVGALTVATSGIMNIF